MRGTLALLDFEDPSIQGVQALMVRGAMLPAFLRCADGRKFIAHLFTLHVSFLQPACSSSQHTQVRVQILRCPGSQLLHCAH